MQYSLIVYKCNLLDYRSKYYWVMHIINTQYEMKQPLYASDS